MDNVELNNKLKEIVAIENICDRMIEVKKFRKVYKQSKFYKETRISLDKMLKQAMLEYKFSFDYLGKKSQELINNLDLNKITDILDEVTKVFANENADVMEELNILKDLQNN